jgi:tetratricopeptide (TPR) repeat protein
VWIAGLAGTVGMHAVVADRAGQVAAVQREEAEIHQALRWALVEDPSLALDIASRLAYYWLTTLQGRTAWSYLSAALDAATDASPERRAEAHSMAGFAGGMAGVEDASAHSDMAIEYERGIGDTRKLGLACFTKGSELILRGHALEATRWLDEAQRCLLEAGDERGLAYTTYTQGRAAVILGDETTARARLREAGERFRAQGDQLGVMGSLLVTGELERRSGRLDDAATALEQLRAMPGGPAMHAMANATLAIVRVEQGRVDEARELAERAVAQAREGFSVSVGGRARHARGVVRLADGDIAGARADLEEAIRHFGTVRVAGSVAECWSALSRLAERSGDLAEARACAEAAVAEAGRSDDQTAARTARQRLAEVLELLEDGEAAGAGSSRPG